MARIILRRVGIAPLTPLVVAMIAVGQASDGNAQTAVARSTATARVVILPSSARVEGGRLIVRGQGQVPIVQPIERVCEPTPPAPGTTNPNVAAPQCRMIVFDLP